MTRLWRAGQGIAVVADAADRPVRFIWQDRPHLVARIVQQWQVHVEWWETDGGAWREYFAVTTGGGLFCVLYRDVPSGAWFLVKIYD